MRKINKLLTVVMTAGVLFGMSGMTAFAENYTYTVTIDGGNQGTLVGTQGLTVTNQEGNAPTYSVQGGRIVIQGLEAGDTISFNAMSGAVEQADEKYYIRGIRQSGRDNSEVSSSAFTVTGDNDYVVAYGIKGKMVAYTVNFQDPNGKELAPSATYYGNIGDKPIVAYQYIEKYHPTALAMTKTLSENEADNVFTFVYNEGEKQTVVRPGEVVENIITENVGGTGAATGGNAPGGAGTAGTTGTATPGVAGTTEQTGETPGTAGADAVTEEPEELIDLDEEEVPLAQVDLDEKENAKKKTPIAVGVGIAVVAVIALIALVWFLKKSSKRKE